MESGNYIGYWWLPSNPDEKLAGIMKVSNKNKIELELLGYWDALESSNHKIDDLPIILGFTKEGKFLTLINAKKISRTLPCPGIGEIKYRIGYVFLGVHFTKNEEIIFFKIKVEYTYLSEWFYSNNQNLVNWDWGNKNISVVEAKTTKGKISIKPQIHSSCNFLEKNSHKYSQIIVDSLDKDLSLDELYSNYLFPLQNLLTLATNINNFIVNVTLYSRYGIKNTQEAEPQEVSIRLVSSIIYKKVKEPKNLQMLFTFKDINNDFSLTLQKWLNVNDDLKDIFNEYFCIKYSDSLFFEEEFLSYVRFLESYHRRKFEKKNSQEHQSRLE